MKIRAILTKVEQLPSQEGHDGREPLFSVSLEGFGVLARPAVMKTAPTSGEVVCLVSVQWRAKGQRPIHWLDAIEKAPLI